jgi:hypothetical protein
MSCRSTQTYIIMRIMCNHISWYLILISATFAVKHRCIHDALLSKHSVQINHDQVYERHPFHPASKSTRRLDESLFQPLRLIPFFDNTSLAALPSEHRQFLRMHLIPEAIQFWSAALAVIPVTGALFAGPQCSSYWANTNPPICREQAQKTPQMCIDMPIPTHHKAPLRVCRTCESLTCVRGDCSIVGVNNSGVENADTVLYIRAVSTAICSRNVLGSYTILLHIT